MLAIVAGEQFWVLGHLRDTLLLEQLRCVLQRKRRALAELVAHLAEVEERRLHLSAAHGSLFSYCVHVLGMSEDEACRRIELARLARQYPLLFGELASGRISLSVALLLKPFLSADNQRELIAAARGTSLRTARELLAARFPRADVPEQMRKLPERPVAASAVTASLPVVGVTPPVAQPPVTGTCAPAFGVDQTRAPKPADVPAPASATVPVTPAVSTPAVSSPISTQPISTQPISTQPISTQPISTQPISTQPISTARSLPGGTFGGRSQIIEPLSPARYRFQFTADAEVKRKLELARDLLRHANPGGDFAHVISRALDLLLDELLRRRFASRQRSTSRHTTREATVTPAAGEQRQREPAAEVASSRQPSSAPRGADAGRTASRVSRPARREVLERDGLGCSWVDEDGVRCGSNAWLEVDHRHPAGKGGSSSADNLRMLCRAHNRLAAERAYGRDWIERSIVRRQNQSQSASRQPEARAGDPRNRRRDVDPPFM